MVGGQGRQEGAGSHLMAPMSTLTPSSPASLLRNVFVCVLQSNEKHAVAAGKKPFYLKKSEQKKLELLARYRGKGGNGGGRICGVAWV